MASSTPVTISTRVSLSSSRAASHSRRVSRFASKIDSKSSVPISAIRFSTRAAIDGAGSWGHWR